MDLMGKVPEVKILVNFLSGAYDLTINKGLSHKYFEALLVPLKGFYALKNTAYSPLFKNL